MTVSLNNITLFCFTEITSELDSESLKSLCLVDQKLRELVENHSYLKITYQLKRMCPAHIFLQLLHYADVHDETKKASQLVLSALKKSNVTVEEVHSVSEWHPAYLQSVIDCVKLPSGTFAPTFGMVANRGALYQSLEGLGFTIFIKRNVQKKYPNHKITLNPYVTISDTDGQFSRNWLLIDGESLSEYEDRAQS